MNAKRWEGHLSGVTGMLARRLLVSLSLVAVPSIYAACGRPDRPPPERHSEQTARPSEPLVAETTVVTPERIIDGDGAVTGGKGCPANTIDSARITEDLVLCGDRAKRGADLIYMALDSVPSGAGRYIEASRSYVPAPDTTRWLVLTRRVGPDVIRLVQGPAVHTARTLATLQLGVGAADSVGMGACRRNHGVVSREIVAVLEYGPGSEWLRARRAWRFVRSASSFEELPPDQVECLNEGGD